MRALTSFLGYEVWCLMGALFFVTGYQILTGKINCEGLLSRKDGRVGFSPSRAQLIVFTLAGAFYYVLQVSQNTTPDRLPDLPHELILAIGGSNLIYVGTKGYSLWARRKNNSERNRQGGGKQI